MSGYRAKEGTNILLNLKIAHGKIKSQNYTKCKTIMEIGAGKLNDLLNWSNKGIKKVYAIEVDEESIKMGVKRFNKYLKMNKKKLPEVIYIHTNILDNANKVYDIITKPVEEIYCNFAIHYFCESKTSIKTLYDFVNKMTTKTFKFTCINGELLYKKLKDDTYIIKDDKMKYVEVKKLYDDKKFKHYGQQIDVFIASIGKFNKEYLVNIEYILSVFSNFELIKRKPFHEYKRYNLSNEEREYSDLFEFIYLRKKTS